MNEINSDYLAEILRIYNYTPCFNGKISKEKLDEFIEISKTDDEYKFKEYLIDIKCECEKEQLKNSAKKD